jgi:uncharacterized protein (TIGR03000 family)
MAHGKWPLGAISFLGVTALLLMPGLAAAQSRVAWRIIIGAPPDPNYRDFGENGMLYPPGYVSGYGYYEDYIKWAPSIVITNQHPPARPAGHAVPGPEDPEAGVPGSAALFRVRLPADAEIWFSGEKTSQRGAHRLFVTPQLEDGRTLSYEVRAQWKQDGKDVVRTRSVTVHAGDRLTLDFLQPAPPAEEGPTVLPPPRPLERPE